MLRKEMRENPAKCVKPDWSLSERPVSNPTGTQRLYNVSFRSYFRYVMNVYTTLLQRL